MAPKNYGSQMIRYVLYSLNNTEKLLKNGFEMNNGFCLANALKGELSE